MPKLEFGLTAGVTGRQEMLTPRHLIPRLVYLEVRVCPFHKFVFHAGLMRLMTFRYLCYFIVSTKKTKIFGYSPESYSKLYIL
jgi:hypothetical protein